MPRRNERNNSWTKQKLCWHCSVLSPTSLDNKQLIDQFNAWLWAEPTRYQQIAQADWHSITSYYRYLHAEHHDGESILSARNLADMAKLVKENSAPSKIVRKTLYDWLVAEKACREQEITKQSEPSLSKKTKQPNSTSSYWLWLVALAVLLIVYQWLRSKFPD